MYKNSKLGVPSHKMNLFLLLFHSSWSIFFPHSLRHSCIICHFFKQYSLFDNYVKTALHYFKYDLY